MLQPDPPARMPQVEPEDFTEETRAFFDQWTGGIFRGADQNPVLRTFAHHPKLADLFSALNVHLLSTNTMPVKLRQIAIMRTAWITRAVYMWSSHLRTSVSAGCSPEMYAPIRNGPQDPYFTTFERVVMLATEELVRDHRISDANWALLSAEWSKQQLLDFMFTVGAYAMIAGVMRSTGAERQSDLLELAEQYGAPLP